MEHRNLAMNSCSWLDVRKRNSRTEGKDRLSAGNMGGRLPGLVWTVAIGVALLISAGPALGQISVEPMKLEIQVTPGKIVSSVINFRSVDPNAQHQLELSLVEVTQSEDGQWRIIEPNAINDPNSESFGFDLSRLSSCKDWIRLSTNTLNVMPLQGVPMEVTLRVPRGLRGFYTAGIVAAMRGPTPLPGLRLSMEFLIPIIIEIEGRAARPRIEATDVGMEFIAAGGGGPARTVVSMRIDNNGNTFSRIVPIVRLWSLSGGYWRVITTREFGEHGIIPGAKLNLKANLNKSLPAGRYRIAGELYVDGRRTRRVQKELDFAGDPRITQVTADKPLDLDPLDITINNLPGATRTGTIKVYNGADATVTVRTALGLPPVLQGYSSGETVGEDLACASWLKIIPEQFTLQGEGGRQNLQIVATMPNTAATHPCYYALLALWATYPDGQQAGVTTMPICIRNSNIQALPEAEGLKINIQELGDSKFLVAASFGNFKNIHFAPITVRAGAISTSDPAQLPRTSEFLSGDSSLWLPFEIRQFSGVLDFSILPADTYLLVGRLEYAPEQFARTYKLIQVSIEGGQRIVRVLGTQDEIGGGVELKW
jgi:hypothetical protein